MRAVLLAALSVLGATPTPTVRLVADTWCPYTCSADSAAQGFVVDVARAALEDAGYSVTYATRNWPEALQSVKDGRFDVALGLSAGETSGLLLGKTSLGYSVLCAYVPRSFTWEFTGIPSLAQVRLGVAAGYAYDAALDVYIAKHAADAKRVVSVRAADPLPELLARLARGEIDVFFEDRAVFTHSAKTADVRASACLETGALFAGVRPADASLATALDAGVKSLRASGKLRKILDRYSLADWAR